MRFDELRREQYELGIAEGAANMQERLNRLNMLLIQQGRIEDLEKSLTDTAFQQQLLEEFGLLKKE